MKPLSNTKKVAILLAAVVTVEAIVVLFVFGLGFTPLLVYDYGVFHQLAINLLDHGVYSQETAAPYYLTYFRAPGYPVFIALVYAIFGRYLLAVRIVQFVILAISGQLFYLLVRRLFSERVAVVSAVLYATYPPVVLMSAMYTAETLSMMFVVLIALQIVDFEQRAEHRVARALFIGVLIAILTFIRPAFILIGGPVALMLAWWIRREGFRKLVIALAALAIGFAVLIAPWMLRNMRIAGRFVGVAGASGWNLFVSAQQWNGEVTYKLLRPEWLGVLDEFNRRQDAALRAIPDGRNLPPGISLVAARELYQDQIYRRDAKAKFRSIPLRQFAKSLPARFYWLWSTGDVSPWGKGSFHRFVQLWHLFLVSFAVAGIYLCRRSLTQHVVLWLVPVYLTLLHMVFTVEPRYTVPGRPFVWVYTAVAVERAASLLLMRRSATAREPVLSGEGV